MNNTIGSHVTLTIFGESHGPSIGVVLDGLCPGLPIETERIEHLLSLRRPQGKLSTARREPDPVQIQSGVFNAHTPRPDVNRIRSKSKAAFLMRTRPVHPCACSFQMQIRTVQIIRSSRISRGPVMRIIPPGPNTMGFLITEEVDISAADSPRLWLRQAPSQ